MNTTNGMKLTITKGTLFLNDDITLEFESAEMTLPEKTSYQIQPNNRIGKSVVASIKKMAEKKVSYQSNKKKPAEKKQEIKTDIPQPPKHATIKDVLLNYINSVDVISRNELTIFIKTKFPDISDKTITNFLYSQKLSGYIEHVKKGTYKKTTGPKTLVKKETKKIATAPKGKKNIPDLRNAKIHFSTNETQTNEQITEPSPDKNTIARFKYNTGEALHLHDHISVLSISAAHADDILDFPKELEYESGVIDHHNEGSSAVAIKITSNGREILAYPHWIQLIKRA